MKLKREHSVFFGNSASMGKGWLVFAFFAVCFYGSAQNYNITTGNTPDPAIPNGNPNAVEVEGNAEPIPGRFIITRNQNSFGPVTVDYTVSGTAKSGEDFVALSGQVTFANQTQEFAEIIVNVLPDDIVENNETVIVTLTSASGPGGVSSAPATVTISDVTDVGVISLDTTGTAFMPNASEEGPVNGQFRILLSKPDGSPVTNGTNSPIRVNYTLTVDGVAWDGVSDFTINDDQREIIILSNETQSGHNLEIIPINDGIVENSETVTLTLNSVENIDGTDSPLFTIDTAANTAAVTIEDACAAGDAAPVLTTNSDNFCEDFTVGLDSYFDGARPAGASLIWTTNNAEPLNQTDWAPRTGDSPVSVPGSYYAFFWDEPNNCNSPTVGLELTQSEQPSAGTLVAGEPTAACSNQTTEFGPNQIDLNDYITGQDAGAWAQSGGPALGNNIAGSAIDFRGQAAGSYEFIYTTNSAVAPCTNATSVVTITVTDCDPCVAGNSAPVLATDVPRTFCDDITATLNDYAPNAGPNATVLRWATDSDNPTDNFVPPNRISDPLPGTYYGFYYDSTNDCASPLLTISLVQNATPEITSSTGNSRCGAGSQELRATANLDATIRWFSRITGGAVLQTGANFTTPNIPQTTSYFVEATANGCTSVRTEVIATIIPQPSAGAPQNGSSCNATEFGDTILDLDATFPGTVDAGSWSLTSGPTAVTLNAENVIDFQGSAAGDYVFTYTTTGAEAPCENATADITISVSSCDTDDDEDGLLGGLESQLGTDPKNPDTDGDGINDGLEVGDDTENPLDGDEDGIIDALDSNILDTDQDGVVDQIDPANENACIPDNSNGLCDTDQDGISDGQEEANGTNPLDACDPDIQNGNCNPAPIDIEVLKVVNIPNAIIGDEVVFTVTVTNRSERIARGIIIRDTLETGFELIDTAVASTGSYDSDAGEWTIPQLLAAESATLEVTAKVLASGPYFNLAELLDSFPVDDNPTNDSAEVILEIDLPEGVDLILEKLGRIVEQNDTLNVAEQNRNLSEVNPLIGQELVFTLIVTNESNDDSVLIEEVVDSISSAFANPRFIPELTPDTGSYNAETGVLKWKPGELLKNGVAQLEIRVLVDTLGTFLNTAEITKSYPADSDGNYDNNSSTVTVNVSERSEVEFGIIFNQFSPNNDGVNDDLKINKRRTNENGTPGDEVDIQYSIKIFNRYGSLVFEGEQLTDEVVWDGNHKGKNTPAGTYFYVLNLNVLEEIEGIDSNSVKKGWIQLIR